MTFFNYLSFTFLKKSYVKLLVNLIFITFVTAMFLPYQKVFIWNIRSKKWGFSLENCLNVYVQDLTNPLKIFLTKV